MNTERLNAFRHAHDEHIRMLMEDHAEHLRCAAIILDQVALERDFIANYEREGSYVASAKPGNEIKTDDGFDGAMRRELEQPPQFVLGDPEAQPPDTAPEEIRQTLAA